MAKCLVSMYQKEYQNRKFYIFDIVDRFRYDYNQISVMAMVSILPDKLLPVVREKMIELLALTDEEKLKELSKFIYERLID